MWKRLTGNVYSTIKDHVANKPGTLTVKQLDKAIAAANLMQSYVKSKSTVEVELVVNQFDKIELVEILQNEDEKVKLEKRITDGKKMLAKLGDKATRSKSEIADDTKAAIEKHRRSVIDATTLLLFNVESYKLSVTVADKFSDERFIESEFGGGEGKKVFSTVKEMACISNPDTMRRHCGLSDAEYKKYSVMGIQEIKTALEKMKLAVEIQSEDASESE